MRLVLSLLLAGLVFADECKVENFFKDRERGFFWKRVCLEKEEEKKDKKEKKEKKEEKKELVVRIPWNELDKMKPSEIRKIAEEAREIAIANPTYENVREYYRFQVWMLKKASKFQEMAYLVAMTDPYVASYAGMIPNDFLGRTAYLSSEWQKKYNKVVAYRDRAGLLVAVKKGCPYCEVFKQVLEMHFIPQTGWAVKFVDVDENPNFARNLQIFGVPDTFLVVKGDKPFILRIATGPLSYEALVERVYWGLEVYEKGGLR